MAGLLDAVGIEKAVLYPTLGLSHGLIQEADWACALARAYNQWLHDRFIKADPRLHGVAILPIQDPQEAIKELRRCVRELGMVAGLLPAVTYNRRPYGSPEFHPIFREAEELGCALAIHGSPQSGLGLEVFERHIGAHVLSDPLPIAMQCISLVLGGVIEKFPKLRVVFLEAGSSWVPFLMERMDFELERLKPSFRVAPLSCAADQQDAERVLHGGQYLCRLRGRGEISPLGCAVPRRRSHRIPNRLPAHLHFRALRRGGAWFYRAQRFAAGSKSENPVG